MCNVNYPKFPCRTCTKNVHAKDKAVQCDLCEFWIQIKGNNLNYLDYRYLQNWDESWFCIECCSSIFTFNSLSTNKNFLACCTSTDSDSNFMQLKELENDLNSSLLLKPSANLELIVNQFNNATPENNDPEKICSSKIMTSMKCITLKYLRKINHYPYPILMNVLLIKLLMNSTSIAFTKNVFDIIAVSETRIIKQVSLLNNLNLNNYSFEFTPTKTSAGGTLFYIANCLSYKC